MASTIITDSELTLTPIATVDTSVSNNGISMFNLLMSTNVIEAGNLIQFEYWISEVDTLGPVTGGNGFIPFENTITTVGISNQLNIAIPSINNEYDPSIGLKVKVRCYVGATTTSEIFVSNWSNVCPVHNAPVKPDKPIAYFVKGEEYPYAYDDLLYVQIPMNDEYDLSKVKFVVSYNYTSTEGNQWVVSLPLEGEQTEIGNESYIVLPSITLPTDFSEATTIPNLYVAVNAIFIYGFLAVNYYTVSEISETVQAVPAEFVAPTLRDITKDDYNIYSTTSSEQTINLYWEVPTFTIIPNFTIDHFVLTMTSGDVIEVINDIDPNTFEYVYDIPTNLLLPIKSTFSPLNFTITAVYSSDDPKTSNIETINTFEYASVPQNFTVAWANAGDGPNEVDIAITFNNPETNGYGSEPIFIAEVYRGGLLQFSKEIEYNSGAVGYYEILSGSVSGTGTDSVVLYMKTKDTNSMDDLNGESDERTYILGELPIIRNVEHSPTELSFDVITNSLLVLINRFILFESEQFTTYPFQSDESGSYYTVSQIQLESGDYQYTFTFLPGFFGGAETHPSNLSGTLANNYGIAFFTSVVNI